jgi:hypothetical protein
MCPLIALCIRSAARRNDQHRPTVVWLTRAPRPTPLQERATRPTAAVPTPELLLPDTLPHARVLRSELRLHIQLGLALALHGVVPAPPLPLPLLLAEIVAEDGLLRAAAHHLGHA